VSILLSVACIFWWAAGPPDMRRDRYFVLIPLFLTAGPGLYALNHDGECEWLTCERCGDYRAVDPTALDAAREAITAAFGYRASFAHFPIVGLCPGCQSSLGATSST